MMSSNGNNAPIYCLGCQYRLDHLSDPRCPECGRAFEPNDPSTFASQPPPSFARRVYIVIATVFVVWHLFVMVVANFKIEAEWINASARRYERFVYVDQGWGMFTSPLWTRSPFLAGRVELSDGSKLDLFSDNEPANVARFFRWGGFRHRKLEHLVIAGTTDRYYDSVTRRYADLFARMWRDAYPDDPRQVARVTLIERSYAIPKPGEPWDLQPTPTVKEIITFDMTQD